MQDEEKPQQLEEINELFLRSVSDLVLKSVA